jgi:hypothetical protein
LPVAMISINKIGKPFVKKQGKHRNYHTDGHQPLFVSVKLANVAKATRSTKHEHS